MAKSPCEYVYIVTIIDADKQDLDNKLAKKDEDRAGAQFNAWIPPEVKEAMGAIVAHQKANGDYSANMTTMVCSLVMKEKKRLRI